jgi:hypothetical protein
VKWTKRSCRRFQDNAARLQSFALAYDLANPLRSLALPRPIRSRSLTALAALVRWAEQARSLLPGL